MIPEALLIAVETVLRDAGEPLPLQQYELLKGGFSSNSVKIASRRGTYLLKWNEQAAPTTYIHEAHSLRVLRDTGVVRVPNVLAATTPTADAPGFLLQEWIPTRAWSRQFNQQLGAKIAQLHRCGIASPGYATISHVSATNNNGWTDWATCYRNQYLRPAINRALRRELLTSAIEHKLERLLERLPELLGGIARQPALIHGDLWRNNILCDLKGQPVLIDPHAAYADHEYELMIAEEYGGFGLTFFAAYETIWPTQPDRRERRDVSRLHPLLQRLDGFYKTTLAEIGAVLQWYVGA